MTQTVERPEAEPDDIDLGEDGGQPDPGSKMEWLHHPETVKMVKAMSITRNETIRGLCTAAMNSTDPDMRARGAQLRAIESQIIAMGGRAMTIGQSAQRVRR